MTPSKRLGLFALLAVASIAEAQTVCSRDSEKMGELERYAIYETVGGTSRFNGCALWRWPSTQVVVRSRCVSAAGTPNVSIRWEQASTLSAADFVLAGTIATITDEAGHVDTAPASTSYGRPAIIGNVGNPSDTTCSVSLDQTPLSPTPIPTAWPTPPFIPTQVPTPIVPTPVPTAWPTPPTIPTSAPPFVYVPPTPITIPTQVPTPVVPTPVLPLSGQAAIDVPNTASNTCADMTPTITMTGAVDGDPIEIGAPAAAYCIGVRYYGRVTAPGVVTVNYCKIGTTTCNPTSFTFKAKVIRP